jgi:hypothetical protein
MILSKVTVEWHAKVPTGSIKNGRSWHEEINKPAAMVIRNFWIILTLGSNFFPFQIAKRRVNG